MKGKYLILDETARGCEIYCELYKKDITIPIEDAQMVINSLNRLLNSSQKRCLEDKNDK